MSTKNIKLAVYTDFSEESRVALNTIIFNTWDFHFDLDVLCILKDDNIRDALEKLEKLKKELNYHLDEKHTVRAKVFLHDEETLLISHINRESYYCLLMGLADSKVNWQAGSHYYNIFTQSKVDISLVPLKHQVKIENRGIVSLEYKNLEKLYTLKRSNEFFKFYNAKIRLFLVSNDLLLQNKQKEVLEFVTNILPELDIELINIEKSRCEESILTSVLASPIDYFLYFNDDHLENIVKNQLKSSLLPGIHKFSLVKMYVDDKIIDHIKYAEMEMPKMILKE